LPERTKVLVSAICAALVMATVGSVRSSKAQAAAGECLAKPTGVAPKGSHWYYWVDRASNRHCWYLRPQEVRPSQARSPKPRSAPSVAVAPESQSPVQSSPVTALATTVTQPIAPDPPVTPDIAVASVFPLPPPPRVDAVGSEPAFSAGAASEPTAPKVKGDRLRPAPVQIVAEPPLPERPPSPIFQPQYMLAFAAAAALLLVVISGKLVRLFAARRLRRRRLALRAKWADQLRAACQQPPVPAEFRATAAGLEPKPPARRPAATPRAAIGPRAAEPRTPDCGAEALDVEASLRRLLREWQRVAA
jgi:hypothetical protein